MKILVPADEAEVILEEFFQNKCIDGGRTIEVQIIPKDGVVNAIPADHAPASVPVLPLDLLVREALLAWSVNPATAHERLREWAWSRNFNLDLEVAKSFFAVGMGLRIPDGGAR